MTWKIKGISPSTKRVLAHIQLNPGITLNEICDALDIRYALASRTTSHLRSEGLVFSSETVSPKRYFVSKDERDFDEAQRVARKLQKRSRVDDDGFPIVSSGSVVKMAFKNRTPLELAWSERPLQRLADNARELGLVY